MKSTQAHMHFIMSCNKRIKQKLVATTTELIFRILFLNPSSKFSKFWMLYFGDSKFHDTRRKWGMVSNKWKHVKHYWCFCSKSVHEPLFRLSPKILQLLCWSWIQQCKKEIRITHECEQEMSKDVTKNMSQLVSIFIIKQRMKQYFVSVCKQGTFKQLILCSMHQQCMLSADATYTWHQWLNK